MRKWKRYALAFAAAALFSSPLLANVAFNDDFESYTLHPGGDIGSIGDLGGGWLMFVNVWGDYPGCNTTYLYGYGVFPAPNSDQAISGIVTGADGQALNMFSDYNNGDHGNGNCIETNVFQETVFSGADAGTYEFTFDTEVPAALGAGVTAYGFVKVLDPNNGYANVLVPIPTVDTATAGSKTISVDLDASFDGMILQWGFANTASNYESSGRLYDNVTFAVPAPPPSYLPVPSDVPTLGPFGLLALLLLVGATAGIVLVRRGS